MRSRQLRREDGFGRVRSRATDKRRCEAISAAMTRDGRFGVEGSREREDPSGWRESEDREREEGGCLSRVMGPGECCGNHSQVYESEQ